MGDPVEKPASMINVNEQLPAEEALSAVVVTGPTASGKSGLALALAREFDGVVINADSMQVYRELRILTARPDDATLAAAPHRLYGCFAGHDVCSAGRWRTLALKEIAAAAAGNRLPIVVGGTGLYLRALIGGLAAIPPVPDAIRTAARRRHAALGGRAFHAALAERDPVMARRLHPSDSQRLVRAWEVLEATGRSLADWQADPTETPPPAAALRLTSIVLSPPRGLLYAACDTRFAGMMEAGALDEVRTLLAQDFDPAVPVMKALGVPELARHLRGEMGLNAAVAAAQQATRRYAKRQLTWLRGQAIGNDISADVIDEQYSESLNPDIFTIIRDFLLTK